MTAPKPSGATNCFERPRRASRHDCEELRRSAQRRFGTSLRSERCLRCNGWHVTFADALTPEEIKLLYLLAIGLRHADMRTDFTTPVWRLYRKLEKLRLRLGAMSTTHLVSVALHVGVVDLFSEEGDPKNGRDAKEHADDRRDFRPRLPGSAKGAAGA
jgi:hypothetical protein